MPKVTIDYLKQKREKIKIGTGDVLRTNDKNPEFYLVTVSSYSGYILTNLARGTRYTEELSLERLTERINRDGLIKLNVEITLTEIEEK